MYSAESSCYYLIVTTHLSRQVSSLGVLFFGSLLCTLRWMYGFGCWRSLPWLVPCIKLGKEEVHELLVFLDRRRARYMSRFRSRCFLRLVSLSSHDTVVDLWCQDGPA